MNKTKSTYEAEAKRFRMPLCDRVISTELSGDYTLPDYLPEIRRILRVSPTVLPPSRYIEGKEIEFGGTADYHMLYIASDGGLYTAPLSSDYSFSAPLDITGDFDLNEGITVMTDIREESITSRVSAPRKLSIKCRLSAHVRAFGMMIAEQSFSGEVDPFSIERLNDTCNTSLMTSALGESVELSDEISPRAENIRVIDAYADAIINDLIPADGAAECRGEATLRLIICRDDDSSSAETITRKIPFNTSIELDDIDRETKLRGRVHCGDISVNVEEGRILCTLSLLPEIFASKTIPLSYTRDLYSTENHCNTAYSEYNIPLILSTVCGNFSQSERIAVAETTAQHGSHIIDIRCKPSAEKLDIDKGKYIISGQCRYSLLLENEGEYSMVELSFPFKYACEGDAAEPSDFVCDLGVIACRGRIDGGNIAIDTELSVSAEFMGSSSVVALSEASFGERVERHDGDIVICYPTPDDTPWSIAKKYLVPVSKISAMSDYILINN